MTAMELTWLPTPCRQCGQPADWPSEWLARGDRPLCEGCLDAQVAARAAARRRVVQIAREQFPELPAVIAHHLVRAGIETRIQVMALTDEELAALRYLGPQKRAAIRAVFPTPVALTPCPHCGGRGWIEESR